MNLGNYTFKQSVNNALMLARSKSFLLLLLIIALAFCVRTYKLQEVPAGLFIDEISGLYTPFLYIHGIVDLSLRGAISYFLSGTFFIYFLAGSSSLFARLSEDVFGTLLVFIVYLLAKEMFSKKVGLISALLIALCPWAVHFSRFQAYSSSYVLLFTTAVMFVYKGINSENERKKIVWYCLGSLTFGLTADIFASSSVFVPVFVTIFLFIYLQKKNKHLTVHSINPKRIFWPLVVVLMFILSYSPIFLIFGHRDGYTFFAQSYSTYSHSRNFADWFRMIIDRAGMHLSPGFLVFTFPHTHDLPFQETISKSSLLRYSPTEYGELNYYGVLLYPGILLLVYEWISKGSKKHAVILWWIVCYALVSGIAYYDNPNAARNIVGMPALIITIALVIDFLLKWASSYRIRIKKTVHPLNASIKPIVVIILSALVAVPTILFLYEYYVIYPSQSAKVFDYGYKQVADFLSTNNLWGRDILINKDPDRNMTLSFYSPHQPPLSRITNTYIRTPYMRKEISPLEISKDITPFYQGTIDYETRIDKGYRGSTSSHIDLVTTANHHLSLAIYHNDSSYTPNSYLLLQSDNKGKSQFDQRPLNQTIEYGKWYKVRLKINSTAISFYFDGKPITTLSRLTDSSNNGSNSNSNAYTSIHLIGESAAVSFKDMVIQQNDQLPGIQVYRVVKIDPQNIVVTHPGEKSLVLANYGKSTQLLKEIYFPDGTVALDIFKIIYHERVS